MCQVIECAASAAWQHSSAAAVATATPRNSCSCMFVIDDLNTTDNNRKYLNHVAMIQYKLRGEQLICVHEFSDDYT